MASVRCGMALGQIQRLFDEGTLMGLTDAQLVERFLDRRDEGAFAALVARHGPMVLAVCRSVLKDRTNAEDAFQATFIVLFRKAGGLKSAGSLGSWLYRVAYRIAIRANAVAARRRERPIEEVTMAAEAGSPGEAEIDRELLPIIHAEIDRLPDRYRAPIALCCLQGLSYEQAAHQLGLPLGTVGSRITRARELLRSRLVRRGVTATTAALSVLLAREATAAPAGWVEAATRAAMRLGEGAGAATAAGRVSAAVALSDHVLRRMLMIRLIQMISVLAAAAMAGLSAWVSLGDGGEPKPVAPARQAETKRVEEPERQTKAGAETPKPKPAVSTYIELVSVVPESDKKAAGEKPAQILNYGLKYADVDRIVQTVPAIRESVLIREIRWPIRRGQRSLDGHIIGTTPSYSNINRLEMERGRFLSKADHDKFENYAVIGSDVARTLFPTEDPINHSVKLGTDFYTIVGVVKERANTSAISGHFEVRDFNRDVYIPFNTCKLRFGERVIVQQGAAPWAEECQLSRLILLLHDDAMVEETAALIRSTLIKPYHPKGDVQVIVIRLQSKSR